MKTNAKHVLTLLLALVLCLSLLPAVRAEEIEIIDPEEPALIDIVEPIDGTEPEPDAELDATRTLVDSGTCGDDLTWKFFSDGEMVIFGEGDMTWADWIWDMPENFGNWQTYCYQTKKITVKSGVTSIGLNAFNHFSVQEVSLPSTLKTIDENAFYECKQLTSITIPSSVTLIKDGAFNYCDSLTAVIFKGRRPVIGSPDNYAEDYSPHVFSGTTAMAVYPDGYNSYNGGNLGGYGGNLTWVSSSEAAAKKPIAKLEPSDQTARAHNSVQFRAHGIGLDLSYQWQCRLSPDSDWFNTTLSGAKTPTLTVKAEANREGCQYRCRISNDNGKVYTQPATLSVQPVIDQQPTRLRVPNGETAVFQVIASGPDLHYQWQYLSPLGTEWINCSSEGNKTAELKISSKFSRDEFLFRCKITSTHGNLITKHAELRVTPGVTTQPKDVKAFAGDTAVFSVKATGADTYQWQCCKKDSSTWQLINSSEYSGVDTDTLRVPVTVWREGMKFRCKLTNDGGSTYTDTATLYVKPKITVQPTNRGVYIGHTARFTVSAVGPNLQYQWQYYSTSTGKWCVLSDGSGESDYKGCTTKTLTVPSKNYRNGLQFRCKLSTDFVSCYTDTVTFTVYSITQPKDVTAYVGDTVSFQVTADSTDTYQWQYYVPSKETWCNITSGDYSGVNTNTLSVPVISSRGGMQYRCKLKNSEDTIYTNSVTLGVKPKITAQPTDRSTTYAGDAFFTVKASGPNLQYQWQYYSTSAGQWRNLSEGDSQSSHFSGTTGNKLHVPGKVSRDGMQFRCRIRNENGTVYTNTVSLSVSNTLSYAPFLEYRNEDTLYGIDLSIYKSLDTGNYGERQFNIVEWQYYDQSTDSWKKQKDGVEDRYDTSNLDLPYDAKYQGMQFRVKVSSEFGVGYSKPVKVKLDPVITTQPSMTTPIDPGERFTLRVKASGSNLKYQWYKEDPIMGGGNAIDGKTSSSLTVKTGSVNDARVKYFCVVTGANGSVESKHVAPVMNIKILQQPKSAGVNINWQESVNFHIKTEGDWDPEYGYAMSFLWQYYDSSAKKWVNISSGLTMYNEENNCVENTLTISSFSDYKDADTISIRCKVICNGVVVNTSKTVKMIFDSTIQEN